MIWYGCGMISCINGSKEMSYPFRRLEIWHLWLNPVSLPRERVVCVCPSYFLMIVILVLKVQTLTSPQTLTHSPTTPPPDHFSHHKFFYSCFFGSILPPSSPLWSPHPSLIPHSPPQLFLTFDHFKASNNTRVTISFDWFFPCSQWGLVLVCGILYFIIWMASVEGNILGSNSHFNNSMGCFYVLHALLGPCSDGIRVLYASSSLLCTSPLSSVWHFPLLPISSILANLFCSQEVEDVWSICSSNLYLRYISPHSLHDSLVCDVRRGAGWRYYCQRSYFT